MCYMNPTYFVIKKKIFEDVHEISKIVELIFIFFFFLHLNWECVGNQP